MNKYIIYALHDLVSDYLYIGKSSSGVRRPRLHGTTAYMKKYAHLPVVRWISKIRKFGNDYEIVILEECETADQLNEAERFYISYFRSVSARLLNCTDGGEGITGWKHSANARNKISAAQLGRTRSVEQRQKMSETRKGRIVTDETRRKIGLAQIGRKRGCLSLSHRQKLSLAWKGRIISTEWKRNISAGNKGRNVTKVTRDKLSLANSGERGSQVKLTLTQVKTIRGLLACNTSQRVVARMFGLNQATISDIKTGRTWSRYV